MCHLGYFWYSLYISPNLAYELALCSRLFRHQDLHKILNDDVTNILGIKFLFSRKKLCCLKDLDERNFIFFGILLIFIDSKLHTFFQKQTDGVHHKLGT